jgi:hypothetical protein
MCIVSRSDFILRAHAILNRDVSQCYTLQSPIQLASFVPPPLDAPPPFPEAVLTIFPDGHECFDHILLSALIMQRKIGLEF